MLPRLEEITALLWLALSGDWVRFFVHRHQFTLHQARCILSTPVL